MKYKLEVEEVHIKQSKDGEFLSSVTAPSCCLVGGNLYILFGNQFGENGFIEYSNEVYTCNLSSLSWSKLKTGSVKGRRGALVFRRNDKVFVFGGRIGHSLHMKSLENFDLLDQNWSSCVVKGTPPGRIVLCAEYIEELDTYILFSAQTGNATCNETTCLSVESLTWNLPRIKGESPTKLNYARTCSKKNSVFICGRMDLQGHSELFKATLTSISSVYYSRLRRAGDLFRGACLATFEGGKLVLLGGFDNDNKGSQVYDEQSDQWFAVL